MSLLVNLGFAVEDAGSERGPGEAVLPPALTCLGDSFYFCPLHSAQGSLLQRGTAVADPGHRRWVGIWWLCSFSCKCGEAESPVSPSKVASHKVADDFSARASSRLLGGHHPPLLLAMAGLSPFGRTHAFTQTIPETDEPRGKSYNSAENRRPLFSMDAHIPLGNMLSILTYLSNSCSSLCFAVCSSPCGGEV